MKSLFTTAIAICLGTYGPQASAHPHDGDAPSPLPTVAVKLPPASRPAPGEVIGGSGCSPKKAPAPEFVSYDLKFCQVKVVGDWRIAF